jgi:hypothetical protein
MDIHRRDALKLIVASTLLAGVSSTAQAALIKKPLVPKDVDFQVLYKGALLAEYGPNDWISPFEMAPIVDLFDKINRNVRLVNFQKNGIDCASFHDKPLIMVSQSVNTKDQSDENLYIDVYSVNNRLMAHFWQTVVCGIILKGHNPEYEFIFPNWASTPFPSKYKVIVKQILGVRSPEENVAMSRFRFQVVRDHNVSVNQV